MKYVSELAADCGIADPVDLSPAPIKIGAKNRVNIVALGDVGRTMLEGLKLLGSDVISEIGICDINQDNLKRLEMEMNQIGWPFGTHELPEVRITGEDDLFDCDLLIFCASKGVPPVDPDGPKIDVRMAQLDANRDIIDHYAALASAANYKGMIAVVSDPVDNLAAAFLDSSGLNPAQFQGYGLGVMNMRAQYYADKDPRFSMYGEEGRAFGPHGQDLVIANSVVNYDDKLSKELTGLTVDANTAVRDLGFKPYIAPALSSAAISIILTLRGEWHYSSVYIGSPTDGAFLGIKNRMTPNGAEYEDIPLDDKLYSRIKRAYDNLRRMR